jgi:N-acetylmuramoyl-L-alanine amidase
MNFGCLPIEDIRNTILVSNKVKTTYRKESDITTIAIHHSLTKSGDAHAFARYHVNTNGWSRMGYTFVIKKDGTIQWAADLTVKTPHVGKHNKYSVGICLVGDFRTERPTAEQRTSLYGLIQVLKEQLPSIKYIKGHSEFSGYEWKECPCIDMNEVRRCYALAPQPASKSQQKPAPATAKTQGDGVAIVPYPGRLIKRGSQGKDVERIQRAVGVTPDGVFGPKTEVAVKAYQKRHGLVVDGIVGPATWNRMF